MSGWFYYILKLKIWLILIIGCVWGWGLSTVTNTGKQQWEGGKSVLSHGVSAGGLTAAVARRVQQRAASLSVATASKLLPAR